MSIRNGRLGIQKTAIVMALSLALLAALGVAGPALARTPTGFGQDTPHGLPASLGGAPLQSTGVGVVVTELGHVMTLFHVAGHCRTVAVLTEDGPEQAERLAGDPERDLQLLKTVALGTPVRLRLPARAGDASPKWIVRFQYLRGRETQETLKAEFLGLRGQGYPISVTAGAPIVGGNSGSPVVLADGSVGGLIAAAAPADRHLAFGVSSASLVVFMREVGLVPDFADTNGPSLALADVKRQTVPVLCYKPDDEDLEGADAVSGD